MRHIHSQWLMKCRIVVKRMSDFVEKLVDVVFGGYYTLRDGCWYYNVNGIEFYLTMEDMQEQLLNVIEKLV